MPPLDAFGPSLAIGLVLLVMLWFAFGTQRNVRKGNDLLRWLQGGLPLLGRRTTMRWLGSSAVELAIGEAESPFREATVVVVLEPRDIGLLWAFARSRGRRDFLIVRANLRRAPRFRLDAGDPAGWTGRLDDADNGDSGGGGVDRRVAWPGGGVAIAGPGADDDLARRTWDRLAAVSEGVWRLTIQPVVPHLEVHLLPPAVDRVPADRVIAPIRDLAAELAAH